MTTTAQVDVKIQQIHADVKRLTERQAAITALIADAWGKDTSALETEFAGNQAKLGGAEIVLERLALERGAAQSVEIQKDIEKALKVQAAAGERLNVSSAGLIEAFNTLLATAFVQYQEALQAYQQATSQVRHVKDSGRPLLNDEVNASDHRFPDPFASETDEIRRIRAALAPHYRPQI